MSASIIYKIVDPNQHKSIDVDRPSDFQVICAKVFGHLPYEFSKEDLPALRIISRLEDKERGWKKIAELVEIYKRILVSVGY